MKAKMTVYKNGGKTPIVPDPKKKNISEADKKFNQAAKAREAENLTEMRNALKPEGREALRKFDEEIKAKGFKLVATPVKKMAGGGKMPKYAMGGKTPIVPDPKKKVVLPEPKKKTGMDALKAVGEYLTTFGYATEGYNPRPQAKPASKPVTKKTGTDGLKAVGDYISTFGFATDGYNPNPKKTTKKK